MTVILTDRFNNNLGIEYGINYPNLPKNDLLKMLLNDFEKNKSLRLKNIDIKRKKTRLAVLKFLTAQEVSPLHSVPVGSIPSLPELSLVRNFAPPLWQGFHPRTPVGF